MNSDRSPIPASCDGCGAPLATDQRYCLQCGARRGAPRVDALAELGLDRAWSAPEPAAAARLRTPRPVTAMLAAAALGFGAGLGALIGPAPEPSAAAAAAPIIALLTPGAAPAALPTTPTAPPDTGPAPATPAPAGGGTASAGADTVPAASAPATDAQPQAAAPTAAPTPAATPAPTPSRHVWLVALTQVDVNAAAQPGSPAPYLSSLAAKGTSLSQYAPLPGGPAANGAALLAGVQPAEAAAQGCTPDAPACTLPDATATVGAQLASAGRAWRAYVETPPSRDPLPAGAAVGLDRLDADLADAASTPAFSLVVPGPCHDGTATPCADGAPAGIGAADTFLRDVVGRITASAAYRAGGIVVIVPDAPPPPPADAPPADPAAAPAATGALVLTPATTAGATVATPTGPLGVLRAVDDALGLPPLGHAAETAPAFQT